MLGFIFIQQGINFTSQTNTKRRFKEQEHQAKQAANTCYRAIGIYYHQENEHNSGQN
ncbi:MAG: hypothetical protein WDO19_18210 [Bacteroidota bacterium]